VNNLRLTHRYSAPTVTSDLSFVKADIEKDMPLEVTDAGTGDGVKEPDKWICNECGKVTNTRCSSPDRIVAHTEYCDHCHFGCESHMSAPVLRIEEQKGNVSAQKPDLSLTHTGGVYSKKVYTVVPKDHNPALGVLPEDQGFSPKYVFLWDNFKSLLKFSEQKWKMLEINYSHHPEVQRDFIPIGPGAFTLTSVPNTWGISELNQPPIYVQ
jgi:predicted RNA-binding Zn-ribbon protein involved in translation (DUF1610 family)